MEKIQPFWTIISRDPDQSQTKPILSNRLSFRHMFFWLLNLSERFAASIIMFVNWKVAFSTSVLLKSKFVLSKRCNKDRISLDRKAAVNFAADVSSQSHCCGSLTLFFSWKLLLLRGLYQFWSSRQFVRDLKICLVALRRNLEPKWTGHG